MSNILFNGHYKQSEGVVYDYYITDDFTCTPEREYITNPLFNAVGNYDTGSTWAGIVDFTASQITQITRQLTEYDALLETENSAYRPDFDGYIQTETYGTQGLGTTYTVHSNRGTESSTQGIQFPTSTSWGYDGDGFSGFYSTNIPIFLRQDKAYFDIYIDANRTIDERNEALKHAINYSSGEYLPETKEYYYYGNAEQYTVNEYGEVTQTSAQPVYRGIRVKTRGTLSLYVIDGIDNGILKLGINIHDTPEIAYYSNDGVTWQNQQGSPTSLPYDYLFRNWEREIGTFYCLSVTGATIQTNIPIFSTKEESDDYNDTGDGIEDAINYDDISTDNPPSNITGEEDDETEFGTIGIRSIFSQQYIMSETALSEVANAFYDVTQGGVTGIFEDIKKGCEMYGDTVVDDIESLVFYPVNLNTVFANGIISQNYIYFGGYRFAMQNSVNRILFPNGYYDFGTFTVETTFGDNIRSYEPYTKLYCYLAYIGWVQLDMKKYLHKTVNIRYYIDTRANTCCAVLIANGVMCDFFNGQIGVSMPLRATDMNAYANAQIQALLGFGSGVGGRMSDAQKIGSQLAQAGATAGETIAGAGALGVLGVGIQGTKTLYGLTQNNINNFNHAIGGSSSIINMMLPQECLFMFEVQEAMPTEYERELVGLPSNASGTVGSFSGYLECEQVNLVCSGATAKEQAEIIRYLYNGVYI